MHITPEELTEFKRIYRNHVGEDLSDKRAFDLALKMVQLYQLVMRPLPEGHRCQACETEVRTSLHGIWSGLTFSEI
ncbi:MAG: hypothetical protein Q7S32_01970 [bacterium]|nr:hypothetical protein [bacterium]